MEDIVTTGDKKKAPPYIERRQKEHCKFPRNHHMIILYCNSMLDLSGAFEAHYAFEIEMRITT